MDEVNLGFRPIGAHEFFWEKKQNIGAGTYLARMTFDNGKSMFSVTEKMVVLP